MDAYIGEMRLFPYLFVPANWLACDGSAVQIYQYQALYAVIGTTFGQPSSSTFQLPNLQGRTALGMGTGPGLTGRVLGQSVGANAETVTLSTNQMPIHTHTMNGTFQGDNAVTLTAGPVLGSYFTYPNYPQGQNYFGSNDYTSSTSPSVTLASGAIAVAGGGQAHPNMQPYLALQWAICCLDAEFPMRP